MDVLQFEIEVAQEDMVRVALQWNAKELRIGDIVLSGDEVNEVLLKVRHLKQQKLDRLIDMQTEGATS